MKKAGVFKFSGYQVFEKVRAGKCGGGLMTIVDVNLNPVVIEEHDDEEILNVEAVLPVGKVNLINAYGPQEYDSINSKIKCWKTLMK